MARVNFGRNLVRGASIRLGHILIYFLYEHVQNYFVKYSYLVYSISQSRNFNISIHHF